MGKRKPPQGIKVLSLVLGLEGTAGRDRMMHKSLILDCAPWRSESSSASTALLPSLAVSREPHAMAFQRLTALRLDH